MATELSKLEKKLDTILSQYIRQRYADKNGLVKCYTCSTIKPWKEMQCGHFCKRHHRSTRWLEENMRVQCAGCNLFRDGNYPEYAYQLEKEKKGTINFLHKKQEEIFKVSIPWLIEKIDFYTQKLNELQES